MNTLLDHLESFLQRQQRRLWNELMRGLSIQESPSAKVRLTWPSHLKHCDLTIKGLKPHHRSAAFWGMQHGIQMPGVYQRDA